MLDLISDEDERLSDLVRQRRAHHSRESAFKDALAAISEKSDASNSNLAISLKAMLAAESQNNLSTELKIEDAQNRKAALEQVMADLSTVRPTRAVMPKMPHRRPDFDYTRKDLREGTDIYRVRELLRKVGSPMLLSDIVRELFGDGKISLKEGKYANLRGTLTGYANEARIFTIESKSPHIIGLIEFNELSGGIRTRL